MLPLRNPEALGECAQQGTRAWYLGTSSRSSPNPSHLSFRQLSDPVDEAKLFASSVRTGKVMQRSWPTRRLAVLVVGVAHVVAAVALLASPAAAQSVNRAAIDELNTQLLYVALPLTLFVELTLVYAIYRFRDNDDPKPTVDDPALEITWTTATAVILVFVGVSGFFVMANPYLTPGAAAAADDGANGAAGDELVVEVTAYQWGWQVTYPDAGVTLQDRIVVPEGRDVRFVLTTEDVIHSLYVPKLGIKQDIFPGEEQVALTRATQPGEYRLHCAELCGRGHARMDGTVVVLEQGEFEEWAANGGNTSSSDGGTATPATNGTETASGTPTATPSG